MGGGDPAPARPADAIPRHVALAALQRQLEILAAMPYALLPFVMVIYALDEYHASPRPATAAELLVTVPLAAAFLIFAPYGQVINALGVLSYAYRRRDAELAELDWDSPRWQPAAVVLRAAGIDLAAMPAFRVFSSHANLTAIHVPHPYPGRWQRMSDWSVDHWRAAWIAGGALGIGVGVISSTWSGWSRLVDSRPFTVITAVADCFLVPAAVILGVRMFRLNISSARHGVVISTQWRTRLPKSASTDVPLFAHEWSHVRHRDVLHRRFLDAYGRPQWFFIFLTAGGAYDAFSNNMTTWLMACAICAVALDMFIMRRAWKAIPLVQEMRADADAYQDAPTRLLAVIAELAGTHDTAWTRVRLTATDHRGFRRTVRRLRLWLWAGWLGYAIPVAAVTIAAYTVRL